MNRETLLSLPAYREELLQYEKVISLEKPTGENGLPDATEKLLAGIARIFLSDPPETESVPLWEKEEFPDENWEEMRGLLSRGIDLSPIVTHVLPLEEFEQGLDMTEQGKCGKCILVP